MILNQKQADALHNYNEGKNIVLTGPAGTGKSYLISHMDHSVKTSTTGCSAQLIGGRTLHSYLGLGKGDLSTSKIYNKIIKNKFIFKRYLILKSLVIDEVSMLSATLLDKINDLFQLIRKNTKPFGGVQIILVGDFYQLPVINDKFCFMHPRWKEWFPNVYELTEIFRQKEDPTWIKILNEIRVGKCSEESEKILKTRIGIKKKGDIKPTFLLSKRADVNNINNLKLKKILRKGNKSITYTSTYNTKNTYEKNLLDRNTISAPTVTLAINAQVIIICNDPTGAYFNGSRGIIVDFKENLPIVKLLNGKKVTVVNYKWDIELDNKKISKTQIPILLGWAITIHKSQGLTLDCVFTSLGESIFEYGQVYVALSRIKSLNGLYLHSFDKTKIRIHPLLKNLSTPTRKEAGAHAKAHNQALRAKPLLLGASEKKAKNKSTQASLDAYFRMVPSGFARRPAVGDTGSACPRAPPRSTTGTEEA
jgi:ATP-dependent DNA helicase PIF1